MSEIFLVIGFIKKIIKKLKKNFGNSVLPLFWQSSEAQSVLFDVSNALCGMKAKAS